MVIRVTYTFILALLLASCDSSIEHEEKEVSLNLIQEPVKVHYSKSFFIDTLEGFQVLHIVDPLTKKKLEYTLVPKGSEGENLANVIYTPIDDLAIFSASFAGFLEVLDELDRIKYVENVDYFFNPKVKEIYESGEIMESGLMGQLNVEKIILDEPEILLINSLSNEDESLDKLSKAGIAVLPIIEWQEHHPLARAEWIKVFGALLDKENLADSLFKEVENSYLNISSKCSLASQKRKALFSSVYQGVWYMPGGKSYVSHFLANANGTYYWEEDSSSGSLPLSFEEVYLRSATNDIWINPDASSLAELYARDGRYKEFVNQLSLGVFQSNARQNAYGGNDYWETGVIRPDLILKDYGIMLHPEIFGDEELYFFKKLN